jgi:hypothetical protein
VNSVVYLALQLAIDEVFIFNVLHPDDIIVLLKATRCLQRRSDNFKICDCAAASLAVRTRDRFQDLAFLFGIKEFLTIDKDGGYSGLLSSFSSTFHSNISSAEYSPGYSGHSILFRSRKPDSTRQP